ncbi:MAG: hypothetical protein Q9220_001315 [cf. Caloplaca sp. 1 TL-2023]
MPTAISVIEDEKLAKPPAARQTHGTDQGIQSWKDTDTIAPKVAVVDGEVKKEPEVDDFGLPIKPPRRRPNDNPENGDADQVNGAHTQSSSRRSSVSSRNAARGTTPGPNLAEPQSTQPSTSSSGPGHDHDQSKDWSGIGLSNGSTMSTANGVSAWSHQSLAPHKEEKGGNHHEEDEWQEMPAIATYDLYDDDGRLIARQAREEDEKANAYTGLGGAGKGYTKVQIDEDALSTTSMDDNTDYLFKPKESEVANDNDDDDEQRDPLEQMQATKDLLTEGQRIAYVGVTRLAMASMVKELEDIEATKGTKKELRLAFEAMKMWSQQMIVRLYSHMDIESSEQIMIEQLTEHGVQAEDLTPALMQNARVKNPLAETDARSTASPRPDSEDQVSLKSPAPAVDIDDDKSVAAYEQTDGATIPDVRTPSQLPDSQKIDIDLRWTVLCDLFLLLIADSIYDARSRRLLERVGEALKVPWLDICRFEKRVTDSLEMQEAANKETWDEAEHLETRRKLALRRRYMMMGLATVGGSLVIGLSAGLLAPVIGAGLAAGFTTIGVAGTSGFLAGAGGTALITSGAVVTGGTIAVRASNRRTGAVRTFEYRPLHNNKRVNLIVTISGWMTGKVDDVRLPFSTIDPVMGDIYSVLWEPDMLRSMGDTINILATEALTQGLQQVLGSTILIALMASLQLPIVLTKLSYLIDNPWTVSMARANGAGLILADSLIDRNLGVRPITLVGFSLGARVIFACLRELANRGAFGLIQNVYLFGSPIVANKDEYLKVRTIVSGRFVNGYASNDWILGYLFRATSGGIMRVAGLASVDGIPGLENIDVTKIVNGHMAYRSAMPRLLREVGWEVESDTFTEIEDPDPDNHEKRQRELIRELDEARKEAEAKPKKRRFGLFKRGKLAQKKGWETYDDSMRNGDASSSSANPDDLSNNVLFDIDAIRAELASEQIEVRQLESTLPPMKLELHGAQSSAEWNAKNAQQPPLTDSSTMYHNSGDRSRSTMEDGDTSSPLAVRSAPPFNPQLGSNNPFNGGYDDYNISTSSYFTTQPNGVVSSPSSTSNKPPEQSPSNHHPGSPPIVSPISPYRGDDDSVVVTSITPPPPLHHRRTSSFSVPAAASGTPAGSRDVERNAWLDEEEEVEEEGFGKEEGEVRMTFG